jgi:hypothetical protein
MQNQNLILLWLIEGVKRWKQKSPKFFVCIQNISLVAFALTELPEFINWFLKGIGFANILPDWAVLLQNDIVAYASGIAFILSKLTVDTTTQKISDKELPFTNKK